MWQKYTSEPVSEATSFNPATFRSVVSGAKAAATILTTRYGPLLVVVFVILFGNVERSEITIETLKLSNFALQSRQNYGRYPYPYSYKYPGIYPSYYQNYLTNNHHSQYPGSNYPISHHDKTYPYKPINCPSSLSHTPHPFRQNTAIPKQSFMDILFSIARNDDLRCVPKIICEVMSGTISGRQQSLNLPININMETLLGHPPLLYFGKAALQGYASKGNTGSCNYAYPECPSDPDKLVGYLNNHNGGFFRYFNGVNPTQNYHPQYQIPQSFKSVAEQRIQNNPVDYVPGNIRKQKGITFPVSDEEEIHNFKGVVSLSNLKFPNDEDIFQNEVKPNENDFFLHNSQNSLKFPTDDTYGSYPEQPFRKPKELPYDIYYYHTNNDLDLQKPLPNHKATPMIFPVRTGTGDLRLDSEELEDNTQPLFYQDDDVTINFNRLNNGLVKDGIYSKDNFGPNLYSSNYERNGRKVTFPSQ
ncbi:hypothetical protein NQ314_017222 [Rhamnusium bicolor]|uniref:Uncharacterized protein n=1 Tax=Rhamnusium bicolor TaxID=1586634 RepID=A0AAV8WV62_9CUCU|nr:hypothetical protein NQ314_017222 [Rhamnusium bicolor]